MRRPVFIAIGAFFVIAAVLPLQRMFVVRAVSDGGRLSMYSKPSVVSIVDGAAGQILFQSAATTGQTFNVSAISLCSGFLISSSGYSLQSFKLYHHVIIPDSSQQVKAEGKETSNFPLWIVAVVLIVLVFIVVIIGVGLAIFFMARRRGKSTRASAAGSPGMATGPAASARPSPAPASYSPSPANYSPAPSPGKASSPTSAREAAADDQGKTIDLSRTVAIIPDGDTAPINYGAIKFVSGSLAGKHFPITPDGAYVGRDSSLAQIVIPDPRISKRHLWIGVREGTVIITDQNSRNGTFINDPKSQRVTEAPLNPGDTVILGESDVARFEYQN
jgi:hypothetical protein